MQINGKEVSVKEAIELAQINGDFLKRRNNGMMLSDHQINVLRNNGINYNNYSNMSSLLFDIEEIINDNYNEELEEVSRQLEEMHYYNETNK